MSTSETTRRHGLASNLAGACGRGCRCRRSRSLDAQCGDWRLDADRCAGQYAAQQKGGAVRAPTARFRSRRNPATIQKKAVRDITLGANRHGHRGNTVTVHVRVAVRWRRSRFAMARGFGPESCGGGCADRPAAVQIVSDNAQANAGAGQGPSWPMPCHMERYRGLLPTIRSPRSSTKPVRTGAAGKALVVADQAQVDSARLQLSFTQVTAPIRRRAVCGK